MSLTNFPLMDGFETTLTQALTSTGLLAYVASIGTFTFPSGVTTNLVLNAGKSNMEIVPISALDSTAKTFTIDSRNGSQGASVTTTAQSHAVGSKVIISDNYQFWKDIVDELNLKLSPTQVSATFDQTVTGTNFRIREDGGDMKLTDDSTAEVSLSTLAAAAGVDTQVRVSSADTTNGFLEDKFGSGDGLAEVITNPAGNEVLTVSVDTTDTTTFVKTSSGSGDEDKVPVLDSTGKIASGFVPALSSPKIGNGNYNISANGSTTIAHGFGTTPNLVTLEFGTNIAINDFGDFTKGTLLFDGTTQHFIQFNGQSASAGAVVAGSGATTVVSNSGVTNYDILLSVDATNITITASNYAVTRTIVYTWKVE